MHRNCRCRMAPVRPGMTAEPWVDFRAILDGMDPSQQRAAVGSSLYRLVKRGVVEWSDAVTGSRVRTLREVVARGKLTVDAMLSAGVREPIARHAWQAVNTPELAVVKAHRKALVEALEGAGVKRDKIIEAAAEKLADRVVVQGIDLGGRGGGITPPKIGPDDLVRLLGLDAAKTKAAVKPKAKAEPKAKPKKEAPYGDGVVNPSDKAIVLAGVDEKVEKSAQEALAAMARLHGLPAEIASLGGNRLRVRDYRPDIDDAEFESRPFGFYRHRDFLVASQADLPFRAHTLAHEFGHWIDGVIRELPLSEHLDGVNPKLKKFDELIRKTKVVTSYAESKKAWVDDLGKRLKLFDKLTDHKEIVKAAKDIKSVKEIIRGYEYFLSPQELWARAYSFWVSKNGGSEVLKKELDATNKIKWMMDEPNPHVWPDEEFKPIAEEINRVFDAPGWLAKKR